MQLTGGLDLDLAGLPCMHLGLLRTCMINALALLYFMSWHGEALLAT